jgi:putative endonuclease
VKKLRRQRAGHPGAFTVAAMDPRHHLGRLGERLAGEHFERLGFEILDRNYRSRHGELDLVAFDGRTLVFCEVKTRRTTRAAVPWDALGKAKRQQVRRMGASWLAHRAGRPYAADLRFDAVGITFDPAGRLLALDHLEDAF